MKSYDLFGYKGTELDRVKLHIEKALGLRFAPHESSFRGGDYYRHGNVGEEEFILQRNYDPAMDEWAEEQFSDYDILLYVNATERSDAIHGALADEALAFVLLRHEAL